MKKLFLVFLLFFLISIVVTWPLLLHLSDQIIEPVDGILIAWIMNWDIHSFLSGLSGIVHILDANTFYPYKNTLAFSDMFFPQAIMALPFFLVFREPLMVYNINFFAGFVLTGVSMFVLLRRLIKSDLKAFLFSIIFTFSTIHLNYMVHLQFFNFWPVILATHFLLIKKRFWSIFFFVIAVLTTAINLYFLLAVFAIFILFNREQFKPAVINIIIVFAICLPFLVPYFLVSREFHYVRPITDAIHFSLYPLDFFNVSYISRIGSLLPTVPVSTPGYPGIAIFLLTFALIFQFIKKKGTRLKISKDKTSAVFLLIAVCSFILALGPGLHIFRQTIHVGPIPIIPLPYAALYYLLPGFSGFRTPSRWIILGFFALTIVLAKHFSKKMATATLVGFVVLTLIEISCPLKFISLPKTENYPQEQKWLARNKISEPIIQFPIYGWFDVPGVNVETQRMLFSTIHWHPMFNGFSGFSPSEWEKRVQFLQKDFPSGNSLQLIKSLGIKLIVAPGSWHDGIATLSGVELIQRFPQNDIYQIK